MALKSLDVNRAHRLLAPRIAYVIGTRDSNGQPNLAPASNLTAISSSPKLVVVAIFKEWLTYKNLRATEGFTVSIPRAEQLDGIWRLGEKYSRYQVPVGQSKLTTCGLPIQEDSDWNGPTLGDAIGHLNCVLVTEVGVESDHGIFIGRVTHARFNDAFLNDEGTYHANSRPLMQVTGNVFATSTDHWSIPYFDD